MQYAPVCGAQEVQCIKAPCYPQYHTYGNACMAGAANARILHEGECTAAETGPVIPEEETENYIPPAHCSAWNDGCNSCARGTNGQTICTLKYCMNPGPGYCTAYDTLPAPDGDAPTTTPTATSSGPIIEIPLDVQTILVAPWWKPFVDGCTRLFGWLRFW